MKQLKHQVEKCLSTFPESRNSDIALTILIWQHFHGVGESLDLRQLYFLPTQESVKRIRAQFNQHGKYLPTDPVVAKARDRMQESVKKDLGYPDRTSVTIANYEAQKLF